MQRHSLYKCKLQHISLFIFFFFSPHQQWCTQLKSHDNLERQWQSRDRFMSDKDVRHVCFTAARVQKTKNQRQWQSKRQSCTPALSSPRKTSQLWTDGRRFGTECAVVTVPQRAAASSWLLHCCFFHTLNADLPVGSTFSQSDGRFRRKSSQQ